MKLEKPPRPNKRAEEPLKLVIIIGKFKKRALINRTRWLESNLKGKERLL
jgi:hypothetical protein